MIIWDLSLGCNSLRNSSNIILTMMEFPCNMLITVDNMEKSLSQEVYALFAYLKKNQVYKNQHIKYYLSTFNFFMYFSGTIKSSNYHWQ